MKNIKKMVAIGMVGLIAAFSLASCTQQQPQLTKEDVAKQLVDLEIKNKQTTEKAVTDAVAGVITALSDAQKARDEQVAIDYKAELDKEKQAKADLQKQLDAKVEEKVKVEVSAPANYEFKLTDDLGLNAYIPGDTYTHSDLSKLYDGEVEFDHDNYDVRETVTLAANSVRLVTSLTYDEDFKNEPYLVFDQEDSIKYNYIFDDPVPYAGISEDEPLELSFLGKKLKIIDADANSITIRSGAELTGKEGDSLVATGFNPVTVDAIAEDRVQVTVDGVTEVIQEGNAKKVNGVDITVDEIFYKNFAGANNFVTLVIGDDVEKSIDSGDDYVEDDDTFQWEIVTSSGNLDRISVVYHPKADDLDDDEPVYKVGQELKFPNNFLVFDFKYDGDFSNSKYEVSFTEVTSSDVKVAKIKSLDGKFLKVGTEDLDVAYTNGTSTFYKDTDNDWVTTTNPIKIDYKENEFTVSYAANYLTVAGVEINTADFVKLGSVEDEAETADVKVGATNLGTREEDVLLTSGVVVYTVESNADKDEVKIAVPSDTVEAVFRVR